MAVYIVTCRYLKGLIMYCPIKYFEIVKMYHEFFTNNINAVKTKTVL